MVSPSSGTCVSDLIYLQESDSHSLRRPHRSTHIHHCRRRELARTLERLESELKYCFTCFDWFVEEEWDEHYRMHLEPLASKRCASITYCNTLFRPAFCPFCVGDDKLPASSRWSSWTREAKLWSHLRTHLGVSHWPLNCPHPSCSLKLQDESSFLFHLSDVHSLRMSPHMRKSWQSRLRPESLIKWTFDTNQKRQRQDGDEQELRPSKQRKVLSTINLIDESSSRHPLNGESLNSIPTVSPCMLSKVSFDDLPAVDHRGAFIIYWRLETSSLEYYLIVVPKPLMLGSRCVESSVAIDGASAPDQVTPEKLGSTSRQRPSASSVKILYPGRSITKAS